MGETFDTLSLQGFHTGEKADCQVTNHPRTPSTPPRVGKYSTGRSSQPEFPPPQLPHTPKRGSGTPQPTHRAIPACKARPTSVGCNPETPAGGPEDLSGQLLSLAHNLPVRFGRCIRGRAAFVEESCRSRRRETCCGRNRSRTDAPVLFQNRHRKMCRVTTSSDACTPVNIPILSGLVQQALLQFSNARAAGRTQARRLLRFDTQPSIAASCPATWLNNLSNSAASGTHRSKVSCSDRRIGGRFREDNSGWSDGQP